MNKNKTELTINGRWIEARYCGSDHLCFRTDELNRVLEDRPGISCLENKRIQIEVPANVYGIIERTAKTYGLDISGYAHLALISKTIGDMGLLTKEVSNDA